MLQGAFCYFFGIWNSEVPRRSALETTAYKGPIAPSLVLWYPFYIMVFELTMPVLPSYLSPACSTSIPIFNPYFF